MHVDRLIEWIISIEFLFVLALILLVYIMYLILIFKNRRDKKRIAEIDDEFIRLYQEKSIRSLPYSRQAHLIIRAFLDWDEVHRKDADWNKNKLIVMRDQILPNAFRYRYSRDWGKRFLLVQCLEYYVDDTYEELVVQLIYDKTSVVSIDATKVAVELGSKIVIDALVDKMGHTLDHEQSLYLSQLHPIPVLYEVLKQKLATVENPNFRRVCYRILQQIGPTNAFFEEASRDVYSSDLELRLSAIRVLSDTDKEKATPILINLLSDKDWLVRNITVQSMYHLRKEDILLPLAEELHDEIWWVRVNAAKVLAHLGEEGCAILAKNEHVAGYEKMQEPGYFLKIHELQERSKR